MPDDSAVFQRMLAETSEATFLLGDKGEVTMVSDKAKKIFGLSEGSDFSRLISDPRNDALSGFILDTIYKKEQGASGVLKCYPMGSDKPLMVEMKTIPIDGEDGAKSIIVFVDDCTEREQLRESRREASILTGTFLLFIALYLFFWQFCVLTGFMDGGNGVANIALGLGPVLAIIVLRETSLRGTLLAGWKMDRKATLVTTVVTVASAGAMILIRWVLGVRGAMSPLVLDWSYMFLSPWTLYYLFSTVLQEFFARGILQNSLKLVFEDRYAGVMAIIASSLIFGLAHIPFGLYMMLAATLLMGALGSFFDRTRSITATSIVHFVLGRMFIVLFGFF